MSLLYGCNSGKILALFYATTITMHPISILFLFLLALSLGISIWLSVRQINNIRRHSGAVPERFRSRISLPDHRTAANYNIQKERLLVVMLCVDTLLLWYWTLGGGIALLDQSWRAVGLSDIWLGVCVLGSLGILSHLLNLPFSLYRTFVLEAKFGFNRTTWALYFRDQAVTLLLSLLLGLPLLWLVLAIMQSSGSYWWVGVWGVWMAFSLLVSWAFPIWIAPLFNRFQPLEETELRTRIQKLLTRCGFSSDGIFVMDGSRRSGHGNAYFTGMGKQKRIVFFDTLLEELSPEGVEAVLAHELGHFHFHHVRKRLLSMAGLSLAGLALLAWLMGEAWFHHALGVSQVSVHTGLALFLLVSPLATLVTQPIFAMVSRRHEFQADHYAAQQVNASALIQALLTLYKENASTLTPDPLHSLFYDSHPPAAMRIARLAEL